MAKPCRGESEVLRRTSVKESSPYRKPLSQKSKISEKAFPSGEGGSP